MRLVVLAVLAVAAVSSNGEPRNLLRKCKPGTQYDGFVHTFYCREDGSGYDWIVKEHAGRMFLNIAPKEGTRCVPGHRWLNDDKICACPSDASRFVCTHPSSAATVDPPCAPGDVLFNNGTVCVCDTNGYNQACFHADGPDRIRLLNPFRPY